MTAHSTAKNWELNECLLFCLLRWPSVSIVYFYFLTSALIAFSTCRLSLCLCHRDRMQWPMLQVLACMCASPNAYFSDCTGNEHLWLLALFGSFWSDCDEMSDWVSDRWLLIYITHIHIHTFTRIYINTWIYSHIHTLSCARIRICNVTWIHNNTVLKFKLCTFKKY